MIAVSATQLRQRQSHNDRAGMHARLRKDDAGDAHCEKRLTVAHHPQCVRACSGKDLPAAEREQSRVQSHQGRGHGGELVWHELHRNSCPRMEALRQPPARR